LDAIPIILLIAGAVILYGTAAVILARIVRLPEPAVECVEIELPSVGHYIALYHYPAENRRFIEPLLLCHGLGANRFNMDFTDDGTGSDRLSIARALARAGFDTWSVELRGRGRARVPKRADWSADDEITQDLPAAIETVLDLTGAERLYWVGHSWGGVIQYLFHARRHPAADKIAGLVTLASPAMLEWPQLAMWSIRVPGLALVYLGLRTPLALLGKLALPIAWLVQLLGRLVLADLRLIDGAVVRRVFASLADDVHPGPARQGLDWLRRGHFCSVSGERDSLDQIDKPALLIAAGRDRIAPPESIACLRGTDVTVQIFPEYGHGSLLLGRRAPEDVFPVVRSWLAARATRITQITHREPGKTNGAPKMKGPLG
jgi:pimeloyl-ACP methyl ester carboxylesterase